MWPWHNFQRRADQLLERHLCHHEILLHIARARVIEHQLNEPLNPPQLIVNAQRGDALVVFDDEPRRSNRNLDLMHPGIEKIAVIAIFPLARRQLVVEIFVALAQNLAQYLRVKKRRPGPAISARRVFSLRLSKIPASRA